MGNKTITQEPKIALQIAKALEGHDGNVTINLNMQATQIENDAPKDFDNPIDFQLFNYIASLPEPRLRNLVNHIYYKAGQKMGKYQAAKWLGVCPNTIYRVDKTGIELLEDK